MAVTDAGCPRLGLAAFAAPAGLALAARAGLFPGGGAFAASGASARAPSPGGCRGARGDHAEVGARPRGPGLAQAPRRKQSASAERIRGIDQHDVDVTRQLQMLKAIVEHEPFDATSGKLTATSIAVSTHAESYAFAEARLKQLHLVAGRTGR